jgi:hypothetical protein
LRNFTETLPQHSCLEESGQWLHWFRGWLDFFSFPLRTVKHSLSPVIDTVSPGIKPVYPSYMIHPSVSVMAIGLYYSILSEWLPRKEKTISLFLQPWKHNVFLLMGEGARTFPKWKVSVRDQYTESFLDGVHFSLIQGCNFKKLFIERASETSKCDSPGILEQFSM